MVDVKPNDLARNNLALFDLSEITVGNGLRAVPSAGPCAESVRGIGTETDPYNSNSAELFLSKS